MSRKLEGDGFTITAPGKIVDVTVTLPSAAVHPIDEAIRALGEGDGAKIDEHRADIMNWLKELRRYRETIVCDSCGISVLGRTPVCKLCHDNALFEAELGEEA